MTLKRFRRILDAYGADPARWPEEEIDAIRALLSSSEDARRMVAEAGRVDRLLDQWDMPLPSGLDPADMAARASAQPQMPDDPADDPVGWRITLGWPNVAGLAAAAAAGFLVGFLGVADVWLFDYAGTADVIPELFLSEDALW